MTWCGGCYKAPAHLNFFVEKPENEFGAVWQRKEDETRFMCGRSGDFLVYPFQCDICWFHNLEGRRPDKNSYADELVLAYIRRVNLDGMWARSSSTIASTRSSLKALIKCWKEIGVSIDLPAIGPWPLSDKVGFKLAMGQLRLSQKPGRNTTTHQQYDTIRRLRSAYSHVHEVSAPSVLSLVNSFRSQLGKVFTNSNSPTQSLLYTRFNHGLLLRMGRQTKRNIALDYEILHLILFNLNANIKDSNISDHQLRWLTMIGGYLQICFDLSLRGNEGIMVEAGGLIEHLPHGKEVEEEIPFVVIPLLGRFKNEDGEQWHLMLSASVTGSGFKVRQWVERMASILKIEGRNSGPAFCHASGLVIKTSEIDAEFHSQLELIQEKRPDLIAANIDVREDYSVFLSLRRGYTSRVGELGLPDPIVDLHNRWRKVESGGGTIFSSNMRANYTELRLTRKVRLKYTVDL